MLVEIAVSDSLPTAIVRDYAKSRDELRKLPVVKQKEIQTLAAEKLAQFKEILGISKAGHVGTLDPNVTGVLPVGLEKATRLADFLHEQDGCVI